MSSSRGGYRSDSSHYIRDELTRFMKLPVIPIDTADINTYVNICYELLFQSKKETVSLNQSYIDCKKFILYTENLLSYRSKRSAILGNDRIWMKNEVRNSMLTLEDIVYKMDAYEDAKSLIQQTQRQQSQPQSYSLHLPTTTSDTSYITNTTSTSITDSLVDMDMDELEYELSKLDEENKSIGLGLDYLTSKLGVVDTNQQQQQHNMLPIKNTPASTYVHNSRNKSDDIWEFLRTPDSYSNSANINAGVSLGTNTASTGSRYPSISSSNAINCSSSSSISSPSSFPTTLVSKEEIEVLKSIKDYKRYYYPYPNSTNITITIANQFTYNFYRDDFQVSFDPFLDNLKPELEISRAAMETNRCFFLHLGVACKIHPYALQLVFRYYAGKIIANITRKGGEGREGGEGGAGESNNPCVEILSTIITYAGFVDAYSLCFMWPQEFNSYRICFISGSFSKPVFSCFYNTTTSPDALRDVIIHCDGDHFTLLRPTTTGMADASFSILPTLLATAKRNHCVVHDNIVNTSSYPSISIEDTIQMLLNY